MQANALPAHVTGREFHLTHLKKSLRFLSVTRGGGGSFPMEAVPDAREKTNAGKGIKIRGGADRENGVKIAKNWETGIKKKKKKKKKKIAQPCFA